MSAVVRFSSWTNDIVRHEVWCPGCNDRHAWQTASGPNPQGVTWDFDGDTERPTVSPSLLVDYGPLGYAGQPRRCHSFIQNGQWRFLSDCTHHLAGQTVPMMPVGDWPYFNHAGVVTN